MLAERSEAAGVIQRTWSKAGFQCLLRHAAANAFGPTQRWPRPLAVDAWKYQ